jgi:hypothetical protein
MSDKIFCKQPGQSQVDSITTMLNVEFNIVSLKDSRWKCEGTKKPLD